MAAGTTALVVAPVAMVTVKGGPAHRRWGIVYYWAMAGAALTEVVLGLWRPNLFLVLVAIFSFYFAFRGRRVLGHKRPERGEGPTALDWGVGRLGRVAVVFGLLGLVLAGMDLRRFGRPPADRTAWWFSHMTGMPGSYLATVSAFSVVNFTFLPTTVRWLWPTLIGTPLIALWITCYKRRFARGTASSAAVAA